MASSPMVADSSIFIAFLRAGDKTDTKLYQLPDHTKLHISVVTLYELLMGATDDVKARDVEILTQPLNILPFTKPVAEKSAEIYHSLRKRNKLIEFRDIFIGATALIHGLPVLTHNTKHFDRIDGLSIL
ncbi:MAG TPA: type II toxin-antitoxin system VapC family toxin [Phaeodactylibacter sp.]|nr:type II toxin-antitoxin system VapC family toxin [Phaeodactylibacter sp.]